MDVHEVRFEGRGVTDRQRIDSIQSVLMCSLSKLLPRVRYGEDTRGNCRCMAFWLRVAAQELDALAEQHE